MMIECVSHGMQAGVMVSSDVRSLGGKAPLPVMRRISLQDEFGIVMSCRVSMAFVESAGIGNDDVLPLGMEFPPWMHKLEIVCETCLELWQATGGPNSQRAAQHGESPTGDGPTSTDFAAADRLLREVLAGSREILSAESTAAVTHYLDHDEYELALEGLLIDLVAANRFPVDFAWAQLVDLGRGLGLDAESVLDAGIWSRFLELADPHLRDPAGRPQG